MNVYTIIVIIYFAGLIIIGWLGNRASSKSHASGQTTWQEEFFTGAKKISPIVLGFTFAATFASGGTFMGHPGLGYTNGFTWSWAYMTAIWSGFLPFILLGKRVFRVGMKIRAVSPNDVIEYRYENNPLLAIALILITVFFYMSYIVSQLSAGARMMSFITGLDYIPGLLIFGGVIVFYVTIAGMRGVAWTDTMQGVLMLVVAVSIVPVILIYAGGMENITPTLQEIDPMLLRGGTADMATSIGAMVSFMYMTHGFEGMGQPAAVQRLLVYDSPKAFKWGAFTSGLLIMVMSSIMVLAGVLGRALFPTLDVADNIVPTIIQAAFPTVIAGIFLAGILSAINSSANSYMLCVSTSIVKDLVVDYVKKDISDEMVGKLTKYITLAVGVLGVVLAIKPPEFIGILVLYAWKGLGLCIGIPLVFGCLWKRANKYGAVASVICTLIAYVYIDNIYGTTLFGLGFDSAMWAFLLGAVVMVVVSLATPPTKQEVIDVFFDEKKQFTK